MAQARGNVIVAVGVLFGVLIHCYITHASRAATYTVGDELGWTGDVSMETWPRGKKFHAGDILVFNYDPDEYNVIVLDKKGFDLCSVTDGFKGYHSGHDRIQLQFGANYFIDSQSNLCSLGMKMAINATAPPP